MKNYLIKKGEHLSRDTEIKKGQRLSPKTEFKKGLIPHNKKEIGYISIRKDKSGTQRRYIKIGNGNYEWKVYATWLWESKKGIIPKGMFIHHKDGNALNDKISNYKIVNRSQHALAHRDNLIGMNKKGINQWNKKNEFNKQKK